MSNTDHTATLRGDEAGTNGSAKDAPASPASHPPHGWLPAHIRSEGAAAAARRDSPNTCPYRAEDSMARLHWLEGYLSIADREGYGIQRSLAVMLRQAVMIARAGARPGVVVTIGGGL